MFFNRDAPHVLCGRRHSFVSPDRIPAPFQGMTPLVVNQLNFGKHGSSGHHRRLGKKLKPSKLANTVWMHPPVVPQKHPHMPPHAPKTVSSRPLSPPRVPQYEYPSAGPYTGGKGEHVPNTKRVYDVDAGYVPYYGVHKSKGYDPSIPMPKSAYSSASAARLPFAGRQLLPERSAATEAMVSPESNMMEGVTNSANEQPLGLNVTILAGRAPAQPDTVVTSSSRIKITDDFESLSTAVGAIIEKRAIDSEGESDTVNLTSLIKVIPPITSHELDLGQFVHPNEQPSRQIEEEAAPLDTGKNSQMIEHWRSKSSTAAIFSLNGAKENFASASEGVDNSYAAVRSDGKPAELQITYDSFHASSPALKNVAGNPGVEFLGSAVGFPGISELETQFIGVKLVDWEAAESDTTPLEWLPTMGSISDGVVDTKNGAPSIDGSPMSPSLIKQQPSIEPIYFSDIYPYIYSLRRLDTVSDFANAPPRPVASQRRILGIRRTPRNNPFAKRARAQPNTTYYYPPVAQHFPSPSRLQESDTDPEEYYVAPPGPPPSCYGMGSSCSRTFSRNSATPPNTCKLSSNF
eukprot:GHVT01059398.1.p1 GENE.GHVT01059398.1~~GHVT01059398.1.p1  ORF type:complete len:575 (-),score=37.19 GHVT01059398.1:286-2010(-)